MADNIITAVFGSGICAVTTSAYRANYGMKLRFSGIELPTAFECDFSNYDTMGRDSITAIGQNGEVQIPDDLWDSGLNIYAYVYLHPTDDSGVTVYTVTIPVLGRPNRTEETPTPHEQSVIEQAISALNSAVEQTAADVETTTANAQATAQSEANALSYANQASASAGAALASQNAAESAQRSATESATNASESARNAAVSASQAAESATAAQEYAEQAERSVQSISGDVERAESAAATATDKATEAGQSATASAASASAALASQNAAHASETAAAQSASSAASSAQNAASSAQSAESSATDAEQAKTDAQDAQAAAETAQAAAEAAAQSVSASAAQIAKNTDNFASEFSTSTAYAIGDYCIYQGTLYRFTSYHVAGAWNWRDVQKVNISNEITRFYMSFAKGIEKISLITGYNISTNGRYEAVQYTTYCMDQMSYFKVADGATSIGISGGKALYVRFYDEELKALGNGGQTTSANFTVQVNSADNPGLDRDAKWVKFGGQANFNGINFINLEPGRFIPVDERIDAVDERIDAVDERIDAVDERIDAVDNYRTITQTDMAEGYIIYSAGGRAANADYVYIENVPVIPKQKVYMTAYFGGGVANSGGISGYDENGDFKCRVFDGPINGNPNTNRTQYLNKEIIIPDGVYYIAFSTRKDGTAPIKLSLGTMFDPTTIVNEAIRKHEIIDGSGTVFDAEVKASIEAVQTVLASSGVPMLTMAVFTDLHHDPKYPNDPINDMFANIKAINDRIHVDALMNLGDAIDGQFQTQYQAEGCLSEVVTKMYETTKKSHNLTGNHDDNVQSTWADRGNLDPSERLTLLELNDVLFKGSSGEVHNPNHITDYYYDLDEYDIRVICIGLNYTSYVQATQTWLENTALNTNKKVLVFSHCATKAEWGYMNDISNGSYVETPLNNFVNNGGTVIAFIHGHTHGDMIETDASIQFTEVAIGCAKFSVPTSGTEGITYQPRDAGDYTKILFDLVCVDQTNRKVHFIRCGAGTDRAISY